MPKAAREQRAGSEYRSDQDFLWPCEGVDGGGGSAAFNWPFSVGAGTENGWPGAEEITLPALDIL